MKKLFVLLLCVLLCGSDLFGMKRHHKNKWFRRKLPGGPGGSCSSRSPGSPGSPRSPRSPFSPSSIDQEEFLASLKKATDYFLDAPDRAKKEINGRQAPACTRRVASWRQKKRVRKFVHYILDRSEKAKPFFTKPLLSVMMLAVKVDYFERLAYTKADNRLEGVRAVFQQIYKSTFDDNLTYVEAWIKQHSEKMGEKRSKEFSAMLKKLEKFGKPEGRAPLGGLGRGLPRRVKDLEDEIVGEAEFGPLWRWRSRGAAGEIDDSDESLDELTQEELAELYENLGCKENVVKTRSVSKKSKTKRRVKKT